MMKGLQSGDVSRADEGNDDVDSQVGAHLREKAVMKGLLMFMLNLLSQ
jgi:hypothetical protein